MSLTADIAPNPNPNPQPITRFKPPLLGKIALVTGATGGIGTAICHRLASLGCSIGMHYYQDQDAALALQEELKETYTHVFGSKFACYRADMGVYDDVTELHEHLTSILGPPNILILSHGTTDPTDPISSSSTPLTIPVTTIDTLPVTTFESTWRTNCGSGYLLTQLCMPAMEGEGWGRIIFISSSAALTGGIVGPHYASSKSALQGLIHWLAGAYAGRGVTVNGVAPALVGGTGMLPGDEGELAKRIPVGRLGMPEEVAGTVLWMIETGYVTNKIVGVDGGIVPQH